MYSHFQFAIVSILFNSVTLLVEEKVGLLIPDYLLAI